MAKVKKSSKKIKLRERVPTRKIAKRKKVKITKWKIEPIFPLQNIPELCLDTIFGHIRLEDLLTGSAGQISQCWYNARARELATKRRQTLFLIQDKDDDLIDLEDHYPYKDRTVNYDIEREDGTLLHPEPPEDPHSFDAVYLPGGRLNAKFTSKLINSLPKITHLIVLSRLGVDNDELEQVIRLLVHYSPHLIKLRLSLSNADNRPIQSETITRLFETINRLPVLEHLKLNVNFSTFYERPLLSILSRLISFSHDSLDSYNFPRDGEWLQQSLRNYASTRRLQSIGCDGLSMAALSKLNPRIVRKFYWVDMEDSFIEQRLKVQLFSRFNSLTCLQLWNCTMPIIKLSQCLAQVTSLTYLKLDLHDLNPDEPSTDDEGQPIALCAVPSILKLVLLIETESHKQVKNLHLAEIFPNLQVIEIDHEVEKCRACLFKRKNATFGKVSKCRRAARKLMLAGCNNLRSLSYASENPQRANSYHFEEL